MKTQKQNKSAGFLHLSVVLFIVVMLVVIGIGFMVYSRSSQKNASEKTPETVTTKKLIENVDSEEVPTTASAAASDSNNVSKPTTKTSTKSTKTDSDALPTPPVLSDNCIYSNSTDAHAVSAGKSTMDLLEDNGYTSTKKFHDAIVFAGLSSEVNTKKTVVFAINDYVWDNKLTQAQRDFMNASPSNMKSVLGWHVVHNCVVWSDGVESQTQPYSIDTVGGPMVLLDPSGHGKLNNAEVGIWDFFSDNGAMHIITDLIHPPSI